MNNDKGGRPIPDLRSQIIKIVNENTLLGEFKAVPVTDQIMHLIQERDTKLKEALLGAVGEDEIPKMHLTGDAGVRLIARDELRAELRTAINDTFDNFNKGGL